MEINKDKELKTITRSSYAVTAVILLAVLMIAGYTMMINRITCNNVLSNAVAENTKRTDIMYEGINSMLGREDFDEINDASDESSELYQTLQSKLNEIRNLNSTRYFYTAKRNENGELIYLVDGLEQGAADFRNPGDLIEEEMIPYIERALDGEYVYSQDIVDTTWGHIFTACYPITATDGSSEIVGALCIETDMEDTYTFISQYSKRLTITAIIAIIIVLALLGCIFLFLRSFKKAEIRTEQQLLDSHNKLERALIAEQEHSALISGLANIYSTIFVLDVKSHKYNVVTTVLEMNEIVSAEGILDNVLEPILKTFIVPEMRSEMREFLDLDTLNVRLRDTNTIMAEYRNNEGKWYQARIIAQSRDASGNVTEVLCVARDFTAEKRLELEYQQQLRDAKEEADNANEAKTNFLRRMSHDVRTPINGIRGMLMIEAHNDTDFDKLTECRMKIWQATDHLLSLVNDVLDMSKLESGKFEINNNPFSLKEVLLDVYNVTSVQAEDYDVEIISQNPDEVEHDRLIGCADYVKRIMVNFMSNAIKYNHEGGWVKVYGRELSFDGKTVLYEFICEDNGIGMSEEFQKHAFEPFTQEEKDSARTKYTGTGLGLAITKQLIDLLGGSIDLVSVEGMGTKITFRLPFEIDDSEQVSEPQQIPQVPGQYDGVKVLLVEDNELNAEIASFMFESHGMEVELAVNGKEAVDAVAERPDYYDIVFMDIMMPVMNGLEAARAIRALDKGSDVPICAMTANAFADDIKQSLDAGMNAHLTKPLKEKEIVDALRKYVKKGQK